MPDIIKSLSAAKHHALRENLRQHSGRPAINRMLAVLTDSSVRDGVSVVAVRDWLKRNVRSDDPLLDIVVSDAQWFVSLAKADAYVVLVKSDAGRQKMLLDNSAALLFWLMKPLVLKAGGLGGQGGGVKGARSPISEVQARWVAACVGLEILDGISEKGFNTALVSNQRVAAELGTQKDSIGKALKWTSIVHPMMEPVGKKGANWRWRMNRIHGDERHVVDRRFGDVVTAIAGSTSGRFAVVDEPQEVVTFIEDGDPFFDDEYIQARKARLAALPCAKNPFGEQFVSAWEPTGSMTGLDPMVAPRVAAEVLLSVRSVIWQRNVTGESNGLNPSIWLAMVAGALGIDGSVVGLPAAAMRATRPREAFGKEFIKRLNAGESFADMVTGAES